jgi:predicted  nucleic acid-binding Zn-ribbon protein
MINKNITPEKIKDIEMALKDISTIYSAAFWRDKCRQLLSDRQALNDRVAELEAEIKRIIDIGSDMIKERDEMIAGLRADVERLRDALAEIHLTRFEKGDFREPR